MAFVLVENAALAACQDNAHSLSLDLYAQWQGLQTNGQWNVPKLATLQSVSSEKLSAEVLLGKQLFYDARDTRLARDRYLSCATCHNESGQDGRVWDLTGMGEPAGHERRSRSATLVAEF